jgi:hypothetical protein
MKPKYIDPEVEGIHPLRRTMSDDELADILEGISNGEDWMTLEQIDAVQDYLFDFIVAEKQNVEGVTTIQ